MVEKLSQQPVSVGMSAYLQDGIKQCRDVYRSARSARWKFDDRFRGMILSSCRHWQGHLHRCHRRTCHDCLSFHTFSILIVNTRDLHVPLNYGAVRGNASAGARFSGKNTGAGTARMIFPHETARPGLAPATGSIPYLCPVVRWDVHGPIVPCFSCFRIHGFHVCWPETKRAAFLWQLSPGLRMK